jgi:tRNA(Ile)-lysidine synthase
VNRRRPLVAKVGRCLRRLGLSGPGVVAVSGGPDSVALWRALAELRPDPPPVVAHLNHQLRGAESDADEAFVRGLSPTVRCDRIDVRSVAAASGDNLEATARRVRYEWLTEVARTSGCGWVATGHTADDQAETVLHRLLRGTGLQGLRGIAPRRPLAAGVELVRPLLGATRAEVLAYLKEVGQEARLDASNDDLRLTRNRIRHELLPHLARAYNPRVVEVLGRLAAQAGDAFADDQAAAEALLAESEKPRAGTWFVFDRGRLAAASRNRVRTMFRLVWQREGWSVARMDFEHWERLAGLVEGGARGVELPGGVEAWSRERVVLVGLP